MTKNPDSNTRENTPSHGGVASTASDGAMVARRYHRAGAALALLVSFVVYLLTMARSAPFWDAGEFIATAYTLGIPHSPGTPLYVLVGKVFTLLPLPFSVAGKVNFISVLFGSFGVVVAYLLIARFLDYMLGKTETAADALLKVAGALVGAFFVAFSQTYWTNSTEAEVYAMSVCFMGFITWLSLKWTDNPTGERSVLYVYLLFYLLALTVGFHLGTILAFSGVFILILMTQEKTFSNFQFLLACAGVAIFVADATLYRNGALTLVLLALLVIALFVFYSQSRSVFAIVSSALFILGISVHFYLMIRSAHNPSIDEADPETWRNLYAVLRREQYPPPNVLLRKASFAFQLEHFNDYFQDQFKMAAAYVGKLNIGSVVPLALGVWGMVDQFAKHRKTFIMLFFTWVVVSLGMIVYLNFSDAEVRERDYFYLPAFYYFGIFIGIGVASLLSEIRRFAAARGMKGMAPIVVPALIFLAMPVFTAKHHYHTHDRSDDYVCAEYAKNMLVGLDKDAILFTNGDNDTFPLWYIQEVEGYRKDVRVVNLSLLNTPWYIKQLKYNEPKVNIAWSDVEIERLRPVQTQNGWVLVRDLGIQHILKYNSNSKPIYFAVTIPPEYYARYRDFMEMEGLAYRIVPRKGQNMVNVAKLEQNIWRDFSYLGLLDENWKRDERVYQPPFVRRLTQNYAAAFTQLGYLKSRDGDYNEAIRNLEVAEQISPGLPAVVMWLGWYYLENGDTTRAVDFYRRQIERNPSDCDVRYRMAGVQERIADMAGALETLDAMIRTCPEHRDAVISAVAISARFGMVDRGLAYLDNWLARYPSDAAMRQTRDELRNHASQPKSGPEGK